MTLSADPNPACEPSLTPRIVLDTNVVLDWLLFGDPAVAPLAGAIAAGRCRWVATAWMRCEFLHVVGRGLGARRGADPVALAAAWARHGSEVSPPPARPLPAGLTCSDRDDQPFVDLALAVGARWLVSRDRALLRLARRAAACGLQITAPAGWDG